MIENFMPLKILMQWQKTMQTDSSTIHHKPPKSTLFI